MLKTNDLLFLIIRLFNGDPILGKFLRQKPWYK